MDLKERMLICRFHPGLLPRTVFSLLLLIMPIIPAFAQEMENVDSSAKPAIIETIDRPAPVFYESGKLKDPFLHIIPPKTSVKVEDEEVPRGDPPSGIEGTFIEKAGIEGIVLRSGDRRIAVIRSADNRAFLLREGDRLFDGYLKTIEIESGSVVFVRETLMRSGKILTQEVTKRLRKS
jgi:hypothetical protein